MTTDLTRELLEPDDDPVALRHARAQLVERAEVDGLIDVGYRSVDSPAGPLLLAATIAGVVKVAFLRTATGGEDAVLAELAGQISPRVLRLPARVDGLAAQLDDWFAGRRRDFDVSLDLQLARGFRRDVLDELRLVPYGITTTYGALAAAAGRPKAVRATGSACATNPLPLVIPCHRVLRSDGTVGGYAGGPQVKAALLAMEASD